MPPKILARLSSSRNLKKTVIEIGIFILTFFAVLYVLYTILIFLTILASDIKLIVPHWYLWIPQAIISACFLFSSNKVAKLVRRRLVIVRILAVISVLLGLIPTLEAIFPRFADTLTDFTALLYFPNAIFVLMLSLYVFRKTQITVTASIRWGFAPAKGDEPIFSRVTYFSGPCAGRELTLPMICSYFSFITSPNVERELSTELSTLRTELDCKISKNERGYQLRFSKITFETSEAHEGVGKNIYAYLDRIKVYLDGVFSSLIIFHKNWDFPEKRISIPLIKPGSSTLFIMPPVVVGIGKGSHTVAVEFLDPSGKVLDTAVIEFNIFDWMRKGDDWRVIPIEALLPGLEYPETTTIYSKEQRLSEQEQSGSAQVGNKITVDSFNVGTLLMKKIADKRYIKHLEITLEAIDDCSLKTIEIVVDENLQLKLTTKKEILLGKGYRYVLRLPLPRPLDLPLGKHIFTLRLFGPKIIEGEQEFLTYIKEVTLK